ncbi:hypothetical protein ZHAS_00014560 [Anopheles sinensis]|uniref:Uncharacterized protein n=1 Tax=Anopheles sinensis TaxID=74873 RepID=A0A084W8V9_ANOSI|nr:hypothetical protein ZHAS_00014560 [Anopheles sinensis]
MFDGILSKTGNSWEQPDRTASGPEKPVEEKRTSSRSSSPSSSKTLLAQERRIMPRHSRRCAGGVCS